MTGQLSHRSGRAAESSSESYCESTLTEFQVSECISVNFTSRARSSAVRNPAHRDVRAGDGMASESFNGICTVDDDSEDEDVCDSARLSTNSNSARSITSVN
ncbi:hypothetical protein KP509_22G073400 [Ceratopteris richardii]|nr:hypothetical protein KP509_22G073400 [Ceratopteris richardii]